ncbi:MAG: hypothetical protein JW908_10420 [Anaerolineales bacterium]|nr:hypothetical protein [Anaerolineales bacterium]
MKSNNRLEIIIIFSVFLMGLMHGLVYVFAMPPWQYNEEPSHFEYAWLIASRLSLPEYPAYDQEKRREIAASMIERKFYTVLGFLPDLNATDEPIWIGTNVTGALPLYHIIAAIPLRLILNANVETQLYVLRLLSLLMFELVLLIAYLVASEFFPPGHALRWLTPASMALLPSFVHLMTSVNNDVGATLMFSFFILAAVRLIKYGMNISRLMGLLVAAALCCLTKNTVIVALPLAFLAAWLALIKSRGALVLGIVLIVGAVGAIFGIFAWGDAAYWYRASIQSATSRVSTDQAPWGRHAFMVEANPEDVKASVFRQLLPASATEALRGKKVTLGAWIWADQPVQGTLPAIFDGYNVQTQPVQLTVVPIFHWMTVQVPADAPRVEVRLIAPALEEGVQPVKIYYDGIMVVTGKWPGSETPVFLNAQAKRGSWGERMFVNPVRNSSAENAWLYIRPWFEALTQKIPWLAHLSPNELLASVADVATSRWLYTATIKKLFETFWAKFAWERISISPIGYQILTVISLLGLLACTIFSPSRYIRAPFQVKVTLTWLGIATLIIMLIVILRGFFGIYDVRTYIPVARYGYPVIIPVMLCFCFGWHKLVKWLGYWGNGIILGAFIILDVYSVITWLTYFAEL